MSELGSHTLAITASGLIYTGAGTVSGVIVKSHTGGTIKFRDGVTAAGTVITPEYALPSGAGIYKFPDAIAFGTGLYASVGGTVELSVVYKGL